MSFFKRGEAGAAPKTATKSGAKPVADAVDAVQHLRLRARHRLIGAALLVGVGVIGFPLLFETQPRPIPVDLPIDIPSKEAVAPLQVPPQLQAQIQAPVLPPLAAAEEVVAAPLPKPEPAAVAKVEPKPEAKLEAKPEAKVETKVSGKPPEKPAAHQEAVRVQSLLEGKPAAEPAGRAIVQVGAFADAKVAQETRMKVEKLGIKTYTQVVETASGKRVRVRVGPFGSRDEADKVAARLRASGLSPAVLTL